ncbi:MAG: hypothetical protein ACXVFV_07125 [Mycobacteriales bacterium]
MGTRTARRRWMPLLVVAAVALVPLLLGTAPALATGCDTNPADATEVGWSSQVAPSGSLAPGQSAQVTATVLNSSQQCVAGAAVTVVFHTVPGGGTATAAGGLCPDARLTPNPEVCASDANGQVPVTYTTPAVLPNGGREAVSAQVSQQLPPSAYYTYGQLTLVTSGVSASEGAPFSGTVATITESGFASPPALTATIGWGDGSSSPGALSGSGATVAVTGSHTYAEESGSSALTTLLDVSGTTAPHVTGTGTATVADAALSSTGSGFAGKAKKLLSGVRVATFTDADPGGAVGDFTATVDWGDGSAPTSGTVTAGSGTFSASGSHTYAKRGTYTVHVSVLDAGGASTTASAVASIQ